MAAQEVSQSVVATVAQCQAVAFYLPLEPFGVGVMKILALDPATKTGWAHSDGASGVWDLKIRPDESSGMRLIRFEGKVHEVAKSVGVDLIVYESVTAAQGARANLNGVKLATKLLAIIERLSEIYDYESRGYNLTTIKKHALPGKGKRDKEAMLKSARAKWTDREVEDDNEADALWLLDLAELEYGEVV